mmetsp:Transcript_32295/g.73224  ORF Transcript_32295/g.73224 Transcript_32295/m.73224 type:complete len:374 (+) Transcript_32295:55-1176(+)
MQMPAPFILLSPFVHNECKQLQLTQHHEGGGGFVRLLISSELLRGNNPLDPVLNMLSGIAQQSGCVLFTVIDQGKMLRLHRASSMSSSSSCSSPGASNYSRKTASSSQSSLQSGVFRKRPATGRLSLPATAATDGETSEPPRKRSSCELNLLHSRSQRRRNTGGSANEEWGEVVAAKPKSAVDMSAFECVTGPRSDVNANSSAANLIGLSIHENQQASSSLVLPTGGKSDHRKSNRTVTFSSSTTVMGENAKTPADLENSWSHSDIPRLLQNLSLIFKVQGISVSYPAASAQELHRQRKTFMTRIALASIDNTLTQNRVGHMKMVLAEQQRQRQSNVVDVEELRKVSAKYSARNIEIANSSWWLERFNYETHF